jgi:resuscitation-promoting factor RpfB
MRRLSAWFSGLSKAGKIGVILASLFVVGAAASPATTPQTENKTADQPTQAKADSIEKKTVAETETVPFKKTTKEDGTLEKGQTVLQTVGVNGEKSLKYEITYTNGVETDKKLIEEKITTAPINQVSLIGTYTPPSAPRPAANCHPSYTGACVPNVSDVDCAGGNGNGPAYVGSVTVVGPDVYDLDRDGDGYGCE